MTGETSYQKYEAGEAMETFIIEMNSDVLTIAHTYELNGDLMYDPRTDFKVDYENAKLVPLSHEMSAIGLYEEYDLSEPTPEIMRKVNSLLESTDNWMDNIEAQGYVPVNADEDISRTQAAEI